MGAFKIKMQKEQQLKLRNPINNSEVSEKESPRGYKRKIQWRQLATRLVFGGVFALTIMGLQTSFQLMNDYRYSDFIPLRGNLAMGKGKVYPSDPNLPTFAFNRFTQKGQGFFNQQMAFAGSVMALKDHIHASPLSNYYQILLPSLIFIDYLGTDQDVPFEQLYDVDHWNTYVPRLPKIVSYNESQHSQYNIYRNQMKAYVDTSTAEHPYFVEQSNQGFRLYFENYMRKLEVGTRGDLDPVDRLILQDALRPSPVVQSVVDTVVQDGMYAAVHLRFEQDYLCYGWPVTDRNLTVVLQSIEDAFGDNPPFSRIFFAINRRHLEDRTKMPDNPHPSLEACEAERQDNLAALNHAVAHGMWNGKVQVFERPQQLPKSLQQRPVIFGSLIDAEICNSAKIFLGRFSSTFTKNIMRRRLIKGRTENYNYEHGFHKMQGQIWPQPVQATFHDSDDANKPLVSFIIPSTLTRETLNRTIESLKRQSIPRWEAIVGVDTRTSKLPNLDESIAEAYQYYDDPRIRVVPITTPSSDRGEGATRNGAGGVRNLIIQEHALADWVAFCDDDDTLSPYYIDYLLQGLHQISKPDILIFRMHDSGYVGQFWRGYLPPLEHGPVASHETVGISFAVRRSIMMRDSTTTTNTTKGENMFIEFEPHIAEDFLFLQKAQTMGFTIAQTCCTGYHVRSSPPATVDSSHCIWEQAYVHHTSLRRIEEIWPHHFNVTRVIQCPAS